MKQSAKLMSKHVSKTTCNASHSSDTRMNWVWNSISLSVSSHSTSTRPSNKVVAFGIESVKNTNYKALVL